MLGRLLLLAWAAGALSTAIAQTKTFPYAYSEQDLDNGLRLVTIPTDAPNLVSVYIVVQTGSRNEVEPGKTGFAHLFEHMMFRGTEKYPARRYADTLQQAGAASNAYTSDDLTVYHTTFSKEDLPDILAMEADRFQNLKFTVEDLKTEAGAVLGEYNKNSSNPGTKMNEVLRDTAFERHTYQHTTMGFIADVRDMPNQYDYGVKFFDRYYRPEYTTIVVTGDIEPKAVRTLVEKSFGPWKRGTYHPDIPAEPVQEGPRESKVDWASPTLPMLNISFHGPAYSDSAKDAAALLLVGRLAFSQTSPLYQKLIVTEQRLDSLSASMPMRVDPYLFSISARLKSSADLDYARSEILKTVESLKQDLLPAERLAAVKSRERYGFPLQLDNSDSVADAVAAFIALRRTPGTIDKYYEVLASLTPEDLRNAARKYLVESGRTIVTLKGPEAAK
jgi:zinc protease